MATHYKACTVILAMCLSLATARADEGDDTLEYYLSKSSIIASGRITSGPNSMASAIGENYYSFKLEGRQC